RLTRWADHPERGQAAAWALGVFIFFDDYANTLIVGNTCRPMTDRLRISREKLSYIVDSTAAPVVSAAVFSTWIGFELGLLETSFQAAGIDQNVYWVFLSTIPFRFYSLLTIFFVLVIALTGRDFGPMLRAERRARLTGQVLAPGARPLFDNPGVPDTGLPEEKMRWWNAVIPIVVVIIVTFASLYISGRQALAADGILTFSVRRILGAANPYTALLWSSFTGSCAAGLLAWTQRLLSLRQITDAWIEGVRSMVLAMIVIVLAWSLGEICKDMHTAEVMILKTRTALSPHWIPAFTFVIAALIGFSTGTSWGTLAILVPIVIPMAWSAAQGPELSESLRTGIFTGTLGAVHAGAIWGDHCSPISDTTIMSSMASGADHIDHVRTQLPYALTIAVLSLFVGYIPAGYGIPCWISLPAGMIILLLVIRFIARPVSGN
ncbi:Na+/H+ antiporter NhaC family protein, partial [bacterium]|nr:Na+/H+ antiporter NhaC family protein [bacterium]